MTTQSRIYKPVASDPASTPGAIRNEPGETVEDGHHVERELTSYIPPPLDLLPRELQDYVNAAAESLNVDVSFILLPLLGALGAAVGNARSIRLKRGFIQPPIIWTAIIGRSGSRKSPALDAGTFAIMERERELMQQNKQALEIYNNALAEWEAKLKKERGVKPEAQSLLTCLMDDMTLEALADAIQENPHGVIVKKDELSHWFTAFDQYRPGKGGDVTRWLSLHTGAFFGLDRRTDKRRYRIHDPRVCITGGIQPQVLARALTEDFFERGLPARFLFAHPPFRKDRWSESTIPEHLRNAVRKVFTQLFQLQPESENDEHRPRLVRLDPKAKDEYVRYYNECGDAASIAGEREEAAWGKLSGYAARLALVGQLALDPDTKFVTGEVMRAACDLARWFGNEAARIYASLAETPERREQRKLVEFIESRGGPVAVRDVITYYRPLKNQTGKAEAALSQLAKTGRGQWEEMKPDGRGRPTQVFRLRPASASAQLGITRAKTANCADADRYENQKNDPADDPGIEAGPSVKLEEEIY